MLSVAAFAAAGYSLAAAPQGARLAAIDWAMLETAIALGQMPEAACELVSYRAQAIAPEISREVVDLGLRGAPNYELLQLTRPDLILSSPFYIQHEARLARIAPVLSVPFYVPGEPPLAKAMAALDILGDRIGRTDAARLARAEAEARFDALAARLEPYRDRPVCLVDIGDARHLRAFGFDSMFGDVLTRLGLTNAWAGRTRFSFLAPIPLERLAEMPEARLVLVGDVAVEARHALRRSVLWESLPQVAEGRLYRLPGVNPFGGVPAGRRFSELLTLALERGPLSA
ncbi:iron-siderophore ABC transporter substrate-binding protein [Paracoccus ravus]|uniref:iron-siderophore ABC transporter substrate-binding protein n=1 Tax=Paracoccus ravus TaxID=2447760 RepID=UPI00106E2290|nr:iron-siderophore ABC transporter substrate-binding protein [Paracoccus ravus]